MALAVLVALAAAAGCQPVPPSAPYRNPVHGGSFADPFVLRVGSTFYAYGTNAPHGGQQRNLPVLTSQDLTTWSPAPAEALPDDGLGSWVARGHVAGRIWAPAVLARSSGPSRTYVLYYTAPTTRGGVTRQCIGTATATSPTGPFRDDRPAPLVCQFHHGGSIDASVTLVPGTRGPNRPAFLVWKSDEIALQDGSDTQLWARPLTADGRSFTPSPATILLRASPDAHPWERAFGAGQIEGPSMVYDPTTARFTLLYSAGPYDSSAYAMSYATCPSYAGYPAPCARPASASQGPWVRSAGGAYGPGGQEAFRGRGHWWIAYHAYAQGSAGARSAASAPRPYDPATVRRAVPGRSATGLDPSRRNSRMDKLCLDGGPHTNAPTSGVDVGTWRTGDCAVDVPR